MVDAGIAGVGIMRRLAGKPRIWVGAVWSCIGLAWILTAALAGPNVPRIVLGVLWLALGVMQGVVALRDRKLGRGFYQAPVPDRALDEVTE